MLLSKRLCTKYLQILPRKIPKAAFVTSWNSGTNNRTVVVGLTLLLGCDPYFTYFILHDPFFMVLPEISGDFFQGIPMLEFVWRIEPHEAKGRERKQGRPAEQSP
jgi:hypothetical protein